MNIYIWHYLSEVTTHYHNGGGVVVVDSDLAWAKKRLYDDVQSAFKEGYPAGDATTLEEIGDPDVSYPTDPNVVPAVFIFADAGCC